MTSNYLALTLALLSLASPVQAAKKMREYYIRKEYTPEATHVNKKIYNKVEAAMTKLGVAIYRNGETYQILIPHNVLFNKHSSNFNNNAEKAIAIVKKWLSFYAINEVHYTALYLPEDVGGITNQAIVRKQTATLANKISEEKSIAAVETITTQPLKKLPNLPFWQNMRLMLAAKSPNSSASIIEFRYHR